MTPKPNLVTKEDSSNIIVLEKVNNPFWISEKISCKNISKLFGSVASLSKKGSKDNSRLWYPDNKSGISRYNKFNSLIVLGIRKNITNTVKAITIAKISKIEIDFDIPFRSKKRYRGPKKYAKNKARLK